jgi:hypothetical protein
MTDLLERAFAEASKLPIEAQDLLAQTLLDDLASEEKWDRAFAESEEQLAHLADSALAEYREGKTKDLGEIL